MSNKPQILFSVPTNAGIDPHTTFAIAAITQRPDIAYMAVTGSPTDQVRNQLAIQLLNSPGYTHLMMMDSDVCPVCPPAEIVDLMLACDAPMVSAVTPIMMHKKIVSNIVTKIDGNYEHTAFMEQWEDDNKPFEVEGSGAGCILIRRDVFETIPWPWFRYVETYPDGNRKGEDIFFSQKAAEYGFKYKVHPKAICSHYKTMDLLEIVRFYNVLMVKMSELKEKLNAYEQSVCGVG